MGVRSVNRWLVLVIVCVAQFMVVLDATIVNVALPSIQHGLHFSASSLQWIVNAYTLVFGGFLLLGGRAGDLLGRKRLFLLGLVIFTGASLLDGLASSEAALRVQRLRHLREPDSLDLRERVEELLQRRPRHGGRRSRKRSTGSDRA